MSFILLCHDATEFVSTRGELLERQGHQVVICWNAQESLEAAKRVAPKIDVAIIHKDLGLGKEPVTVDHVVAAIREKNELARIGIWSGEYPHGKSHVLGLGADFYMSSLVGPLDRWFQEQVTMGLVSPKELQKRGKEVATPIIGSSSPEKIY